MQFSYITSKMNGFMFSLNEKMGPWLEKRLSSITENWWEELVLANLSELQRDVVFTNNISDIKGLDLASLLRVFDKNWFVMTSTYFINNRERANIKKMQQVRNSWAHIAPNDINKEKVIDDVNTIIELLQFFDASMKETMELESFIFEMEDDIEIVNDSIIDEESIYEDKVEQNGKEKEESEAIQIGNMVALVSDEDAVGVITAIENGKYFVFIDNKIQSFYKEQLKLIEKEEKSNLTSIKRVKYALTAYQINNPGSSNLYSLNTARIDFVPYQFRPALKLIKSDSPRLLIADDVGVGKTIEAGLILKELEARSNINSVLIICPRPLVAERKWVMEMKRFDEDFTQLDGKEFYEALYETKRDGEWPERHNKTIIPFSLFSEDSILGTKSTSNKRKKRIGLSELDPLPHFDLVIVDEAHNIRNADTWMYKAVDLLIKNADAAIFLTATPIQNSNNDLYTLLNLLRPDIITDKSTFDSMSEPNKYVNNLLSIVRRQNNNWQGESVTELNNILGTSWGRTVISHMPNFEIVNEFVGRDYISREEKVELISRIESLHSFNAIINRTRRKDIEDFCIRRTTTLEVAFSETQKQLYDKLMEFESTALGLIHGDINVRFMMSTIMRQASSCIYSLAPFLKNIISRRFDQIKEDGELYEKEVNPSEEYLNLLSELAREISQLSKKLSDFDPKFEKMYEVIEKKQKEENNKIIIFSSFRGTLGYINRNLEKRGIRVGQVDGSVADEARYELRTRFMMEKHHENAIDVLLFTEVGTEGLDYQFCDTMINYDLPWNPMRIEQRIGRIDRRGQKSETVKIYNMISKDTIDAVVYDRCLSKIGVFEESIGECSDILGDVTDKLMKIMFDSELSDDEREYRIEQMADNEVLKVQEMRTLEQEEKTLFGFDLSNYVMDKDVQDAENPWISQDSIQKMIEIYLEDYLGKGEYILGKSELKTLRLSSDNRNKLFKEFDNNPPENKNNASRLWRAYLKSSSPFLSITFDSECAKDHRETTFLTQMHPLVIQASNYGSRIFPCEIGVYINDDNIASGEYEFLIYAWKYVGLKPDIRLVPVSNNDYVTENILSYLQYASEYNIDPSKFNDKWDSMDNIHYEKWILERENYIRDVKEDCNFRKDQTNQTYIKNRAVLKAMIEKAEDPKIVRMRESQLSNLEKDNKDQVEQIDMALEKADIHTNLLLKGILHIN